ncbi:putative transmembrane protein [Rhizoctonia solani 123E]|uniref:Putative transmembrane protein n=1 Tax=Rhizoctonia solani 123E TaxID=1423351 RepID=A0A074RS82_9AGAM|nr:putative transmembrane protein [Rhizoctonia solani 123E]
MSTCPAEPEPSFCTSIISNADIAGRGVRISIYAGTILSMTVASFIPYHEKAFRDSSRNAYIVSTSLMIASLIEWKTHGLSLFDALIVTMLTTMMTTFVTVNGPYIRTLGLSINIASFLFTTFWCYWGLQVWQDPSTFGVPRDGENCTASTETIFVVFGHNVGVTNSSVRNFALSMFAIGIISAFASLCYSTKWLATYTISGATAAKDNAAMRYARKLRLTKGQHMSRYGGLAGMIYLIVTIEQMVDRNNVKDQLSEWTYSQTIALIMLLQQIMDCISYFKEEIEYRGAKNAQRQRDQNERERLRMEAQARTSAV